MSINTGMNEPWYIKIIKYYTAKKMKWNSMTQMGRNKMMFCMARCKKEVTEPQV